MVLFISAPWCTICISADVLREMLASSIWEGYIERLHATSLIMKTRPKYILIIVSSSCSNNKEPKRSTGKKPPASSTRLDTVHIKRQVYSSCSHVRDTHQIFRDGDEIDYNKWPYTALQISTKMVL